jgi:hypothetical protein
MKCRHCGEWIDERWRVGGAGKVCLALLAGAMVAMAAMTWTWVPAMRGMLAEFRSDAIPWFAELVLSVWWLPAWIAVVAAAVASSFVVITRSGPRETLLACALAAAISVIVLTWWGMQMPIAELAEGIRAE